MFFNRFIDSQETDTLMTIVNYTLSGSKYNDIIFFQVLTVEKLKTLHLLLIVC